MTFFSLMIIMTFSLANGYHSEICWTSTQICSENSGDQDGYYVTIEVNGNIELQSITVVPSSSIGSTGYTITCSEDCCYTMGPMSSTPSIILAAYDDEYWGDKVLYSVSPSGNAGTWHLDADIYTSCTERIDYVVTDLNPREYDNLELVGTAIAYIDVGTSYEGCKTACEQDTDCNYLSYGKICYTTDDRDNGDCNTGDICRVYTTYTDSFYNSYVTSVSYDGALPTAYPTTHPTPRPTDPTQQPTSPTPQPTSPTPPPTYPTPQPTTTTTSKPTTPTPTTTFASNSSAPNTILIAVISVAVIVLFQLN